MTNNIADVTQTYADTEAVSAGGLKLNSIADIALKAAARFWFVTVVTGQWIFVYYIMGFYGGAAQRAADRLDGVRRPVHSAQYMYNSVAVRTKEIATLRALGFKALPVGVSTIVESAILALIGALIAAATIYAVFNGYTAMTSSGNSLAVQLDFAVTPRLIVQGIACALIVGLIGGIFPAIRAGRLPVATALRES